MKNKTISVELEWNKSGCPWIDVEPDARIRLSVHQSNQQEATEQAPPVQPNHVCLEGNRPGLVALAKWLLALADEESVLDHQHFDNDVSCGFYRSSQGWELIVSRTE